MILNKSASSVYDRIVQLNIQKEILTLCKTPDELQYFDQIFLGKLPYGMIVPYSTAFRRIGKKRILFEDKFRKQPRNADYADKNDEFFSEDHLYFSDDGYMGFSDYSIIGSEYSESGFAPYAVALHIVYFDNGNSGNLRVHHFVSIDNDDAYDPASKLYQALMDLMDWNQSKKLDTLGIKEFEKIYTNQSYPGLGVVKRLSLMHHLELMGRFLDGDNT